MEKLRSADGTTIAFDRTGHGPALVLVVGAFCDRHTTRSFARLLAPAFTVFEYDRRGRGASGNAAIYSVEREIEDLAAVVAVAGEAPFVFGHSSGAVLALEAAARDVPITRLVAYEPPYIVDNSRERPGDDLADRLATLVSAGSRGDAVKLFLTEAIQVPPHFLGMIESGPDWTSMTAIAHTLSYDVTLCNNNEMSNALLATIHVPALVLGGSNSPGWYHDTVRAVAAAIPNARHQFLDGQGHNAADDVLARVLIDFARDRRHSRA
jgi:pimeloyl-ACP methyl ester carboxylesterase